MGIKGLNTWLHATFPGVMVAVDEQGSAAYDHVLFDLNGIVHAACRRRDKEKDVLRTIINELDALLRIYPARRTVLIALDGPGPEAKLLEQRKRRIDKVLKAARDAEALIPGSAEALRREELRRLDEAAGRRRPDAPSKGRKRRAGFDSLQVTPGTLFMLRVRRALEYYAASRLCGVAGVWSGQRPAVFVSGADVAGEGEIKLLQHLRQLAASGQAERQSALLVGPDADLLLLALAARPDHTAAPVDVLTTDAEGRRKLFRVAQLCAHFGQQLQPKRAGGGERRAAEDGKAGPLTRTPTLTLSGRR